MAALKEIGDRLDGKPHQSVALTDSNGQDLDFTINFVPAKVIDAEYSEVRELAQLGQAPDTQSNDINSLGRPENGTDKTDQADQG